MTTAPDRVILGIDPGTSVMGFGIITVRGKKYEVNSLGVMQLSKLSDHYSRLEKIFTRVTSLVKEFGITEMAIEAPFYGVNVQSMLKLGRAQGVCIAAAMTLQIPVHEYAPRKIKLSVTGNGNASKEQVADMLKHMLVFQTDSRFLDATDALAVALCHINNSSFSEKKGSIKSWEEFIKKNPGRKL
ncbi:MAG: crossover junction endodeoxyribonuclease RuvC [Bacteroidetes bacterium HGW-Bacteroidetes-21]|jgi:crossover junction endodeoxyribonuclease RuvC|nr:MAG: crossover junction endodeoxyribonuclease RuvC [Bacteroidetes bacterium HGW-Bacteroidetes-21]